MNRNFLLAEIMFFLLFFCSPVDVLANNCHVPDSYPKGHWMQQWKEKGSIIAKLEKSYIHVVESSDTSYDGALAKAKKEAEDQADTGRIGGGTVRGPKYDLAVQHQELGRYCEFEDGTYTVYLLYQTAFDLSEPMEKISTSTPDNFFSAKVFVPGMAQINKGQKVKGALFIAGEALFIGGIAASFGMSSYYKSRSNDKSLAQDKRNAFENWADVAWYTGWTFVGLAAALYIANIIDGAVAPVEGFTLFDENGKRIVFTPVATFDSVGLAMNLNF